MMIDRKRLVQAYSPRLGEIAYDSPLTVGNGGFAYTVDVTGMQSLGIAYARHHHPLCTMSNWGWHVTPTETGTDYSLDDLVHTTYQHQGRTITLPVQQVPGNEAVYAWLRENPHRFNLAQIGLVLDGQALAVAELTQIDQTLDMYHGVITSRFKLRGEAVTVVTLCHADSDTLAFEVDSQLTGLGIQVAFPYGASNIAGADWDKPERHTSHGGLTQAQVYTIQRAMDNITYQARIVTVTPVEANEHSYHLPLQQGLNVVSVVFEQTGEVLADKLVPVPLEAFWEQTGLISFAGSTDARAFELERRIMLSLYLSKIQGTGNLPPQETGLTCNSWHGKHHLEMHLWHSAYLPLYNHPQLLLNSLSWYKQILPQAQHNARKNGYKGARWPKQVGPEGIDSPSLISPLLVWQQPHILHMLDLIGVSHPELVPMMGHDYALVIQETADFICDYLTYNLATGRYDITAPVIPAQEVFDPLTVYNPTFELAYLKTGLAIAARFASVCDKIKGGDRWLAVKEKIAALPQVHGHYLSHANAPDTFERYQRDHPAMLMAYGLLDVYASDHSSGPSGTDHEQIMRQTLDKVIEVWDYETMWGWDFAVMAMTAKRLGNLSQALDLLLMNTPKNTYVVSGNNNQNGTPEHPIRTDLPLYLPGNGSLLLAVAHLFSEYNNRGIQSPLPGWQIQVEHIASPL